MTCAARVSLCRICTSVSSETEYSASSRGISPRSLNPRGLAVSRLKTTRATASYLGFIKNDAAETSRTTKRKKPTIVHFLLCKTSKKIQRNSVCEGGGG